MKFLQDLRTSYMTIQMEYDDIKLRKQDTKLVVQKYMAITIILRYVMSGAWTKDEQFAERARVFLQHPISEAIEILGLRDNNHANTILNRINTKLCKVIGAETARKILEGDPVGALADFKRSTATEYVNEMILPNVVEKLPEGKPMQKYDIIDCMTEIKFLAMYSEMVLMKRLEAIDTDKLRYLREVLDYASCNPSDTYGQQLLKIISGDAKADSLQRLRDLEPVET